MSSAAPEVVQPGLEVVSNKPPTYKDYTPMPQSPYQKAAYAATVLESPADHKTERSERTVMGMRVATFCLLVALILVIVVAGVGGGVGGTLAVNNAKKNAEASAAANPVTVTQTMTPTSCPAPTVTGISTNPSAAPPAAAPSATAGFVAPTPDSVALDCPKLSGTNTVVSLRQVAYSFTLKCGQDFGSVNGKAVDLIALTAYSLSDCIRACVSYNSNGGATNCKGVAFNNQLAGQQDANFGNCWLKNSTEKVQNVDGATQIGAVLSGMA